MGSPLTFKHVFVKYEILFLKFVQTAKDARRWMTHVDPKLGVQLPEQDYGGNCLIYDPNNTENPWHNFWVSRILLLCCLLDPTCNHIPSPELFRF